MSNLILAPSFRLLLRRLLEELRTRGETPALAPRWVITPTSTLATSLRTDLLELSQAAGLAGIRVVPLLRMVQRLSQLLWVAPAPRWSPLLEIRLFQLLEREARGTKLEPLVQTGSGHLLRATFLDLADAGFGPDQIELLNEVATAPETDGTAADALRLYAAWLESLERQATGWAPLQQQSLAEAISLVSLPELAELMGGSAPDEIRLYIYGFYDFTDVSAQVLAALARRLRTDFFLPFSGSLARPHPGFAFMRPVLQDLVSRLGSALGRTEILEADTADQTRFFLSTFPEGPIGKQPPSLTFQHAAGLRAEVVAAAIRVRSWLDDIDLGLEPGEVVLVAPQPAPYLDLVREVFESFAIPLNVRDLPIVLTPHDRVLHAIARLWEEQAPPEWLLGYCREFPQISCLRDVNLDVFESKLRRAAFDGKDWARFLELGDRLQLDQSERAFVAEIAHTWTRAPGSDQVMPASQACEKLEQIAQNWLPDPAILSDVVDALKQVEPDETVPLSLLLHLLLEQTGQQQVSDPQDQPGVLFLPMMRARGLSPRAVVLLGLASGRLPFQIEEDPLLADRVRLQLSQALRDLGHCLAPKSVAAGEMVLLFLLLNGSAELVHWIVPDSDDNGRTVAPTPWVQRYLQRWERPPLQGSLSSRVPRGPAEQARLLLSLDSVQGRFLPPAFAAYLDRDLGTVNESVPYSYLLEKQEERQHEPARNGVIGQAARAVNGGSVIRVTELEKLSRCPFQFYNRVIAGWNSLSALEFVQELKPTEWGTLLHRLFENTLASFPLGLKLQEIAAALLDRDGAGLSKQIAALPPETSLQFALLPELLKQAARNKLLQVSRDYWQGVQKGEIPDGSNICTEKRCSAAFPGLADLGPVMVSGQIDRLDNRDGRRVIIDYKSGREPDNIAQEMRVGFRLQPLLYRWLEAGDQPDGTPPARFSYVFFGKTPIREKPVNDENLDQANDWLEKVFAPILKNGCYPSVSNEALEYLGFDKMDACQYCDYVSLCRRFERGAPERLAGFMRTFLPERLKRFQS